MASILYIMNAAQNDQEAYAIRTNVCQFFPPPPNARHCNRKKIKPTIERLQYEMNRRRCAVQFSGIASCENPPTLIQSYSHIVDMQGSEVANRLTQMRANKTHSSHEIIALSPQSHSLHLILYSFPPIHIYIYIYATSLVFGIDPVYHCNSIRRFVSRQIVEMKIYGAEGTKWPKYDRGTRFEEV